MLALVIEAIRVLSRKGVLPRDLAARALDGPTRIDDLAIDSLGKLSLLSELEERADVALSEGMIAGIDTLNDLANVVKKAGGRP